MVSPQKVSQSKNLYIDVNVCTATNSTKSIRVMLNSSTNRVLFVEKNNSKSPIKITNLSESKSGTLFFNSNIGSRLTECVNIDFAYTNNLSKSLENVKTNCPTGPFDVVGKLKWCGEVRTVLVGKEKNVEKCVRDGVLGDQSGVMKISIWGDMINSIVEDTVYIFKNVIVQSYHGIKLTTTVNTVTEESPINIDVIWGEEVMPELTTLTCTEIISSKVSSFLCCVNISCCRKVVPFPGELTVTCNNPTCRRKMLVKKCLPRVNVEITVERDGSQINLTMFENILKSFFNDINY